MPRRQVNESLLIYESYMRHFSGGPMVCMSSLGNYPELYGIVSFGVGCALPGNPGVYTNVARFRNWIKSAVEGSATVDVPDSKSSYPITWRRVDHVTVINQLIQSITIARSWTETLQFTTLSASTAEPTLQWPLIPSALLVVNNEANHFQLIILIDLNVSVDLHSTADGSANPTTPSMTHNYTLWLILTDCLF